MSVEVLIPVKEGSEWNQERAVGSLPPGTRYTVAEYPEGEYADAVNDGVRQAKSDRVLLSGPDVWQERDPSTVHNFDEGMWNADIAYGPLVHWADGRPAFMQGQELFCPVRLYRENYLPSVACVGRDAFLAAGGFKSGMWELYVRMHEQGRRVKYVAEAMSARDAAQPDPSPAPTPKEVKATFYYQATPGTAYWRCLLPARYLPAQAIFNHPTWINDEDGRTEFPQHQGTCVMQFAGDEAHYMLAKTLKDRGVRVLIEVDDNYAHWFKDKMTKAGWVETIAESLVETPHGKVPGRYSVECHVETVKLADGVIVASPMLVKQYRKHNPNVFLCRNQIDPADWPEPAKPDDGVFRIGMFASASHSGDQRLVERGLEWAAAQPDVEVVHVGLQGSKRYPHKQVPWSNDLSVYKHMIQEFDVNLCPVVTQPWAQFRSDLKVLEGSMAGALSVVSDGPVYAQCDVPHIRKCKTPKDWLREIQWCVQNRDLVREQGAEAREYVLENRIVKANIRDWELAVAA